MKKYGYSLTSYDLDSIIRRIDTDSDGMLCLNELSEFLISAPQRSPKKKPVRAKISAPQKSSRKKIVQAKKGNKSARRKLFSGKDEIINVFLSQLEINRRFERIKSELASQHDFNLLDFYRMIDLTGKGYLSPADFRGFCYDLRVLYSEDDLTLIFKHFGQGGIGMREFEMIWEPKDQHFAYVLAQRRPLSYPPLNRTESFTPITVQLIVEGMNTLIEC